MKAKIILQFAIGPIGAAVLSLVTLPFVAWFFSVEDVGRLTMLQVVLSLSVSLFSLAMHQAYVREYHEEADKATLFKVSLAPGLLLLFIVSLIALVMPLSISKYLFGIDSSLLTFFLFMGIYSSFFINFLAHVIRMQERGLAFSATQIAPKLFLFALIGLVLLLNITAEFKVLMSINTISVALTLFVYVLLTRDTLRVVIKKSINYILLNKMLRFSLPLVAGGIAYWGLATMDRFFLRSLSGFEELGVYALAASIAGAVSVLTSIFSSLWHPVLYKWVKEGVDKNNLQCVIENVVLIIAFVWSLAGLFSFIIKIFLPAEYVAIEYLVVACVAMPLFYLLSEVTASGIGITRRSSYSMLASIVAFMVNAILNYLLIPIYGASGAALASVFAFFMFFAIKTESSALLWCSLPRVKIYVLMLAYMLATTLMVLNEGGHGFYIVWLGLLLFACCLFFERLLESFRFVESMIRSGED